MSSTVHPQGRVIGQAGFGLAGDVSWAANAEVAAAGAKGEARTADALGALAAGPGGPTVLHDVAIPIPGFTANIDHVLVYGNRVLLLDTKWWRPGFYWTLGETTHRGGERFEAADKQTMKMASQRIANYLTSSGAGHCTVDVPLVLIWPSRTSPALRTWALSIPGARPVEASRGLRALQRRRYRKSADAAAVSALVPLVASVKAERVGAVRARSSETDFEA